MSSVKDRIYENLKSADLKSRMNAIRQITELESLESLQVLEAVIKTAGNLGMKMEALTVLPEIKDALNHDETYRILDAALGNPDLEVARTALLAILRMPQNLSAALIVNKLFQLLHNAKDTDIQYYAILSLSHLRSQIPTEAYYLQIHPFAQHVNAALCKAAKDALSLTATDVDCKRNTH